MGGGGRVNYRGGGGSLFAVYLMAIMLPLFGVYILGAVSIGGVMVATRDGSTGQPSTAGVALMMILGLALSAAIIGVAIVGANKLLKYYWENMTIEGKACAYHGTAGGLVSAMLVPALLTACTMGIYTPWYICKLKSWVYSQIDVSGERLQFNGDGGGLLGIWLLGSILCSITCFIYFPWHHNNLLEYEWNNTTLSGRPFRFQKDPGGFFGMWLLNTVLVLCTSGFYTPWAMSNAWDWEAKHIG
jgi:uncharacterized membrane protein YjgN (DUF898 family)